MSASNPPSETSNSNYWAAISDVRHLRVNREQPPTSNWEVGMDFERCAALHNAIVRHGWTASGYPIEEMPQTSWWDSACSGSDSRKGVLEKKLHPAVLNFLKRALFVHQFPGEKKTCTFFCHLSSMIGESCMFESYEGHLDLLPESGHREMVTLYWKDLGLGSDFFDGIIFNQRLQEAMYCQFDPFDILEADAKEEYVPWHPLEAILSGYIDLIESGKVVALNRSVPEHDWIRVRNPDGTTVSETLTPSDPRRFDPVTGYACAGSVRNPWRMVAFTPKDVEQTLKTWELLVEAIESRMPASSLPDADPEYGLYSEDILSRAGARESSFAHQFFSAARKPRCTYLGPGLRLQTPEEFAAQPLACMRENPFPESHREHESASREKLTFPFLILCGEGEGRMWPDRYYLSGPPTAPSHIPCGLYLDRIGDDEYDICPWSNGGRLVLPYNLVGYCDYDITEFNSNTEVLQLGHDNPFLPEHTISIALLLESFLGHIRKGLWTVGSAGVEGDMNKFREVTERALVFQHSILF